MENTAHRAIAIVGVGAILPDAPNAAAFWDNIKTGRYSIREVPEGRWDPALYYDADPGAPDKTYSKIGGWVREYSWEPMKWRLPIPPRVADGMDIAQRWAVACTREALEDFGYPQRPLDLDRTAVILGNAMAGEKHYLSSLRVFFPEYAQELEESASFAGLPEDVRHKITHEFHQRMSAHIAPITEDTMPGELANCMAGRIANLYNFHGPNYVCDAACASAMAAISSAVEGLVQKQYDAVITGGVDRNMGAPTFVKFCKIGALSATGTRPYAQGADGFVMGEGAAIFLMRRLADAERDHDKIYAVLRGVGGSSDGKGKGITAPNPVGQKFCVERAWENAGLSPATATMIEGHGTSTRVGDVVEAQSMTDIIGNADVPLHSIALGSVKSNIGHLKGAAGAAGILKVALALHEKVLPPSLNCQHPSPEIDFAHSPLYVNTELKPWATPKDGVRRAGASAFGFGGTNFHVVLEEHIPGRLNSNGKHSIAVPVVLTETTSAPAAAQSARVAKEVTMQSSQSAASAKTATEPPAPVSLASTSEVSRKTPLRGALVIGATTPIALVERLREVQKAAIAGSAPAPAAPAETDLRAPERVAIDYADAAELASKAGIALKAFAANQPAFWKAIRAQGIFRGSGPAPKVAFLYTGQGSQYANMLRPLCEAEPIIGQAFAEANQVMTPLLGKPLTDFIFVDSNDPAAIAKAEDDLRQTEITQPAVMAIDIGITRLLAAYGVQPDMTMGHSLGEYGALVASGVMNFHDAMEAVSARGRGMAHVAVADRGRMAAVFAPLPEVERLLKTVNGYVVIANVNSNTQSVIGGASDAVGQAVQIFLQAGYNVVELPVSHAFHTTIVAPASEPLRAMLSHLNLRSPKIPVVANVNGEFYPTGEDVVPQILDLLAKQVASPVQFVKGLRTLYDAGARVFVEIGPKKALQGFAEDVLGEHGDVVSLFTNHPKVGDLASFNQALCGLYAAGLGAAPAEVMSQASAQAATERNTAARATVAPSVTVPQPDVAQAVPGSVTPPPPNPVQPATSSATASQRTADVSRNGDKYATLGRYFADVLEQGWQIYGGNKPTKRDPVVITGAALGLPGTPHIFDDENIARLLRGEQFIDVIPSGFRNAMAAKHITRLVKSDNGGPTFESISDVADVIKLAGRGNAFDLEQEFGVSTERNAALDRTTALAIASGIDALRDAGIPLVLRYKKTSLGTRLPDRWGLPDSLRDETGVIFASAFPGYDAFAEYISGYHVDRARREQLQTLEALRSQISNNNGHAGLAQDIDRRIAELRGLLAKQPYIFDRRFLFRVLSMGHSQFAELIGARGPNTQINAACASTTQGVTLAEDWIRAGRCRRVIVVSADDVTSDNLIEWMGSGFLASGAAATDEVVAEAATPFDRRRHGLIMGMGAASLVVESADAARERGLQPICEVLSGVTANSAFHGSRLDVSHICQMMESVIAQAEATSGISRHEIAPKTVFVSHETYTPARGGSASAEIMALRHVFGDQAGQIVIANTKGFTGHAMATGIEDVLAVKSLETGLVPPVANFKEVDPELGALNLSKGGKYPVEYALRLGAGFGSQISMTLVRWIKTANGVRPAPDKLGYAYRVLDDAAWKAWLSKITEKPDAELEVVTRTLRVRDPNAAPRAITTNGVAKAATPEVTKAQPAIEKPPIASPAISAVSARPELATAETPSKPAVVAAAPLTETTTAAAPAKPEPAKLATAPPAAIASVAPKPEAPSVSGADAVKDRVLALAVEKTGYPADMLDLDLDLEADLGVDTVKQAEMFAAIREIYNIPRDENRKLRDYPTLAHVIRFVYEQRPDLKLAPASAATPKAEASVANAFLTSPVVVASSPSVTVAQVNAATSESEAVKERILALAVEKTGYPADMLDLDLDLEADLGVDTVKQAEMFAAIREIYNIPRDENRKLRDYPTLAHVIRFVYEQRPDLKQAATAKADVLAASDSAKQVESAQPPVVEAPQQGPTVATARPAESSVKDRILALAVEKTGYPADMLDLDLDLEADLGVDTVKQAEMFAAIREIYNIPRDENRKLRDYPTLAHVIRFVYEQRPDLAGSPAAAANSTVIASSAPLPSSPQSLPVAEMQPSPTQAAAPQPATPSEPPVAPEVSEESITQTILAIVAEKTGYPPEMLDLDLDLEADLGIDTVKQAEMFAAVRAAYNIPRDENMKLRDFPTLAHVIQFARDGRPGSSATKAATAAPAQKPEAAEQASSPSLAPQRSQGRRPRAVAAGFEAANLVPRRVPVPVLRPPLNMCKPTGVALETGARVLVMPDKLGIASSLVEQLHAQNVQVHVLDPARAPEALAETVKQLLAAGPIQGVYWLPALDHEGLLASMTIDTWHEAIRLRVKSLYAVMRVLFDSIAGRGTFLVGATLLGGQHGYDEAGACAPMGGAVTGFLKTYKRERPETLVKTVDFEASCTAFETAALLIEETLRDPGAVEIGYKNGLRWTISLEEQPAQNGGMGLALDESSVFVVTGAAGSIVSAITADLATASGGTFYLLDLVPEPDPANPDLQRFGSDKDGLKRDLFARIQARGERATPAMVEKELAALERAQAALSAIEAVRCAGGTAHYFSVNLADPAGVARVIDAVRERNGKIDVLLHAAGLERSHFLPDKDAREFDLVFDVKADGWFNLLHAIGTMPLGATVAFSSIAGRFGNGGQTDYSAANDLLCKYTSSFRTTRPQTRGIAIDWTAWGGIGMATRGSIPKMMEAAGIDMLPPEAGTPLIRRELTQGSTRGEVVVARKLGVLLNEWDATGGLDVDAINTAAAHSALASREVTGPMTGKITGMTVHDGLTMETTLDPTVQPFLNDHRIDGTPVLPGVMGVEAFAEAAVSVHPGWHVQAIEQVNFLAPFKFYRDETRAVVIHAVFRPQGESLLADCRLIGRRLIAGHTEPQETVHFTARVRLGKQSPEAMLAAVPRLTADSIVQSAEIYRIYFHGPAYQVVDRAWWDGSRMIGELAASLPSNHQPPEKPTLMAPRLIELCFQTAGLWEMAVHSRMGLPHHVRHVSWLRAPQSAQGRLYAVVTPDPEQDSFDAQVVDAQGNCYVHLNGYSTSALPEAPDAELLKPLQNLIAQEMVSQEAVAAS